MKKRIPIWALTAALCLSLCTAPNQAAKAADIPLLDLMTMLEESYKDQS